MNRRSFFSSLGALIGAASLSPNIFIPKFEPVKWKSPRIIPNPKWLLAEYRCVIISAPGIYDKVILHQRENSNLWTADEKNLISIECNNAQMSGTWSWEEK